MKKSLFGIVVLTCSLFANDVKYDMNFTKDTTGAIRHIKLYKNPTWASKIDFKNGKTAFFCSPKSMFEFYHNMQKWEIFDIKNLIDFQNILVTDFKTLKTIDATKAFFVYGAHDISPAGDDLVPFASKDDAIEYLNSNNGKRILDFNEVKNSLIRLLNGRT